MIQYHQGQLRFLMNLSGLLLGKIPFFFPMDNIHLDSTNPQLQQQQQRLQEINSILQRRVGTKMVFAWPFPEAATTAQQLGARGNSYAAMGTAPDIWNDMLGILVRFIPRRWWRNPSFSQWLADFSQPLVWVSDQYLKWMGIGETHAMRIDVTFGRDSQEGAVSILQAHDSFRTCVGQSCAEFALDVLLEDESTTTSTFSATTGNSAKTGRRRPRPGVYLPEQRYQLEEDRKRILDRLTTTPGTIAYTGPVRLKTAPDPPTDWYSALGEAIRHENGLV